jgi:hypothetical protein
VECAYWEVFIGATCIGRLHVDALAVPQFFSLTHGRISAFKFKREQIKLVTGVLKGHMTGSPSLPEERG